MHIYHIQRIQVHMWSCLRQDTAPRNEGADLLNVDEAAVDLDRAMSPLRTVLQGHGRARQLPGVQRDVENKIRQHRAEEMQSDILKECQS